MFEGLLGRALGKAILGLRIAATNARRAPLTSLLTRAAVKTANAWVNLLALATGIAALSSVARVLSAVLVLGCCLSLSMQQPVAAAEQPEDLNTLTDAEKSAGWKLLFDGKTTDGWRGYKSKTMPDKWKVIDGNLTLRIPLPVGGEKLAPLACGIGEIDGDYLCVIIKPWLAEKLRIAAGSLVVVDNKNGTLTITRSAANDQESH